MAVSLTDIISYKRLVAAGNNELFYEDINVPGTMTELAAANGDIDTSDQLTMFESYQKVFIINGTNLKIADFINTKLTITALTTAPTKGATVTQATSGATMVVDSVSADKTVIYGYTTSGTFVTTGGYTLSGGGMAPETRVPSAVAEATTTPHWYDYVVYPDGASGVLPTKVYLGCAWRGRIVLSGNPNAPNQWYMSRQANPFDYAYIANDAQSPVAGGEDPAVPGQVGDIIRALVPFGKDYLLFGCASTIWAMSGDPAEGGSLNAIDETVGIFGANSWCLDGEDNLYFWGTGGIYMMQAGLTVVENLTRISLPDLIDDEGANPSTHRITMAYDRKNYGVIICITKLSDGTNSNYFYSLNPATKGLYPESYPEECGAYSLFFYAANDVSNRDLLVGCKDGFIRKFDPSAKDDNIGGSDETISSHVSLGPLKLASEGREGLIHSIKAFTTGGDSSGTEADSNDLIYKVFAERSAGAVTEKMIANSNPKISGTLQATGLPRGRTKKKKVRGVFAGIRIENTTAGETMSFDRLLINAKQRGRIK